MNTIESGNDYHTIFLQKEVDSPEQTSRVAAEFAGMLKPGDIVAFYGDLGSGKTFFIKILCHTLGTLQEATSPSFTIINEYLTNRDQLIYHFDFYRLESQAELLNLGLDEFFYNDYLCFIEWADKIADQLPPDRWEVYLNFSKDKPEHRHITIKKRNGT